MAALFASANAFATENASQKLECVLYTDGNCYTYNDQFEVGINESFKIDNSEVTVTEVAYSFCSGDLCAAVLESVSFSIETCAGACWVKEMDLVKGETETINNIALSLVDTEKDTATIKINSIEVHACEIPTCEGAYETGEYTPDGCPIYKCPVQDCAILACLEGEESYFTGEYDSNDCPIYKCRSSLIACAMPSCEGAYKTGEYDSNGCPIYECPSNECVAEGGFTSGPVSPEYQTWCCDGLKGFDYRSISSKMLVGTGLLCYDPEKGIPECRYDGTKSEGWYYPSDMLLVYADCEQSIPKDVVEFEGKGLTYGDYLKVKTEDIFMIEHENVKIVSIAKLEPTECTIDEESASEIHCTVTSESAYEVTLELTARCIEGEACPNYFRTVEIISGETEKLSGEVALKLIAGDGNTVKFLIVNPANSGTPVGTVKIDQDYVEIVKTATTVSSSSGQLSSGQVVDSDGNIIKSVCSSGCTVNGNCVAYGIRMKNGHSTFCDIDGQIKDQLEIGAACENNFECQSNSCSSGECIDLAGDLRETKGLLQKLLDWLNNLF